MTTWTCPCCHQRVLLRHGVRLSPKQADIFDAINARRDGIEPEVLCWMFWGDKPKREAQRVLYVTIHQINDMLGSTGIKVASGGRGLPYRVWGAE